MKKGFCERVICYYLTSKCLIFHQHLRYPQRVENDHITLQITQKKQFQLLEIRRLHLLVIAKISMFYVMSELKKYQACWKKAGKLVTFILFPTNSKTIILLVVILLLIIIVILPLWPLFSRFEVIIMPYSYDFLFFNVCREHWETGIGNTPDSWEPAFYCKTVFSNINVLVFLSLF